MGRKLLSLVFVLAILAGLIGALSLFKHATPNGPTARRLMHDQPIQAAAFRYYQRLSEDGTLPENAFVKAKAQRDAMLLGDHYGGIFPASWTWLGPGNIGGRIRAILIDPTNPSVMYIGSASGGIWKTINGGTSWVPLDDFIPGLAVGSMAMDPTNPNILYAGTGEGFAETVEGSSNTAFIRGAGIFKSIDAGQTWNQIQTTAIPDFYFVNRLAISPVDPQILLAATATGIFRSTDGGLNWVKRFNGIVYDLRFHPTDGSKAVAGLHDDGALYSLDGGQTWTAATGALGHRTELCYSTSSPTTVYAAISETDRIKIYRSTNGGQSYVLQTSGSGISTYAAYNNTLWVDPTNPNTVILGGVSLFRSTDSGVILSGVFGSVHSDMHVILSHPGFNGTTNRTVFFGTDGGIYRTTDAYASSATALNNNLGITQFYGAVMNPISGVVYGGTQDNGTLRFSGNPQAWTRNFGGDGGICATDPTDANYFYGEIQWADVFRSTNGGVSAAYIWNGITDRGGTLTNFITELVLDPNNPNRLLVGCRRLWRSDNAKAATPTWSAIKPTIAPPRPDPTDPPNAHMLGNSPYNISCVAIAEGNSNLVFVGYNNGQIWKSINGTVTTPAWTRLDDDVLGPLPDRWVSQIVIDPSNHNRIYATIMGWESNNVWRSLDGGVSWTEITGSGLGKLPSMPISAFALHRTEPGWLYAGSDLGMFTSVDDGASWTTSNQGPALVPVEELRWKDNSTLLAVTHGRGAYVATVTPNLDPTSPTFFRVVIGTLRKGPLSWLFFSDDKKVQVDANLTSGDFVFPILVEMKSTVAFSNPAELRFALESSTSVLGQGQRIFMFNYQTSGFEQVDSRSMSTVDQTVQVNIATNPSRFIDSITREVKVRIAYFPSAADIAGTWTARLDQAFWTTIR